MAGKAASVATSVAVKRRAMRGFSKQTSPQGLTQPLHHHAVVTQGKVGVKATQPRPQHLGN